MGRTLNPFKESRASNATGMDISRKKCPNYLKAKGKVYATTLSDSDSSSSDSDESCNGEGNFFAFMTIDHVESSDDLSVLVEELGEHTELESIGIVEESDDKEDDGTVGLQETYNSFLENTGEYVKVANASIKKMKRVEEDCRSLLIRYKETKCEMEMLNGKLTEAYSMIKFLELQVVQANAKVERVSSKMKYLLIKSHSPIKADWDTPVRVIQMSK